MRSVTCSCTCLASAPGQKLWITMTLKVNGGSSDCDSALYDSMPNSATIAIRKNTSA